MRSHEGLVRQADAVMAAAGGRAVLLRMPTPALNGADAEQLGLATPEFQDVELWPVAYRNNVTETSLLVSATAVTAVVGTLGFDSVDVLLEGAVGVVVDGVVFEIAESVAMQGVGGAYCYCLTLRAPVR